MGWLPSRHVRPTDEAARPDTPPSGRTLTWNANPRSAARRAGLERRPLGSSPGGARHSGPQGRGGADPNRWGGSRLGTYAQQMRRRGRTRERRPEKVNRCFATIAASLLQRFQQPIRKWRWQAGGVPPGIETQERAERRPADGSPLRPWVSPTIRVPEARRYPVRFRPAGRDYRPFRIRATQSPASRPPPRSSPRFPGRARSPWERKRASSTGPTSARRGPWRVAPRPSRPGSGPPG